jgi:hypothetical protein
MTGPAERDSSNKTIRDLQRAGEDMSVWMIRPTHAIKLQADKRGPFWFQIDGTTLLAEFKRVLAKVNPTPD